jgi:hypothetical protein
MIAKLERRVELVRAGIISAVDLLDEQAGGE